MLGVRAPAYLVASGLVLLAAQGPQYVDEISLLPRERDAPVVDWNALKVELAEIARVGYATNRGTWREDIGGLAAPVFDRFQRPVASLGISGPLDRLRVSRMKELAPLVVQCAEELSRALGYTGGHESAW